MVAAVAEAGEGEMALSRDQLDEVVDGLMAGAPPVSDEVADRVRVTMAKARRENDADTSAA